MLIEATVLACLAIERHQLHQLQQRLTKNHFCFRMFYVDLTCYAELFCLFAMNLYVPGYMCKLAIPRLPFLPLLTLK